MDKRGTILKISVPSCTNFCTRFSRRKSRRHKAYYIYKYILVQKYNNILYRVCPLAPPCVMRCAARAADAGGKWHTLLKKICIFVPRPEKPIWRQEKTWYKNRYRGVKNLYQAVQKLYQKGAVRREIRKKRREMIQNVYGKYRISLSHERSNMFNQEWAKRQFIGCHRRTALFAGHVDGARRIRYNEEKEWFGW